MKLLCLAAALALTTAVPAAAATIAVTSSADHGDGTLREAIERANDEPGSTIELPGGKILEIVVDSALPALRASGTVVNGNGATLREGSGCERPGHKKGCDGLVIVGERITVRNIRIAGFLFDGISVHGAGTSDVHLEEIQAIDNRDDGIGIAEHAGPVVVERCLLMGNGFRTKGKGVLVFSDSEATVRDCVVVANRDGITVTRGSNASLEHVLVAGNYDKGIGTSAASLRASAVSVLANGRDPDAPGPNADGVRVGLGGTVELRRSRIAGNGDTGVVVLDTSTATLRGCRIEANHGRATSVAADAHLERR